VHADAHVGLDADAGGEAADASDPHHPRSPRSSGARGASSGVEVQQGQHRGESAGDEGGVPSVPAETGEAEAERTLGKRMLSTSVSRRGFQADLIDRSIKGSGVIPYCPAAPSASLSNRVANKASESAG